LINEYYFVRGSMKYLIAAIADRNW